MNPIKLSFYEKYKPIIVMSTGLIAVHYGWFYLQKNERIVPVSEQLTEFPITTVSQANSVFNLTIFEISH